MPYLVVLKNPNCESMNMEYLNLKKKEMTLVIDAESSSYIFPNRGKAKETIAHLEGIWPNARYAIINIGDVNPSELNLYL